MIDYNAHDWRSHLFDIEGSMVKEIIGRVSICVAWSAAVVAFHVYVWPIDTPGVIHSYLGLVLGLLLVFRTNASYDRFWEGRRQWGSIVNESRNLARASRVYLKEAPVIQAEVVRWTVAFAYATMHSLRGNRITFGSVEKSLPGRERAAMFATPHVPLAIATRMSGLLAKARDDGLISDYLLATLDQNVQLLIDYMGACERIHKTPLPFPYVVHLRRSLILYCYTLPFALVDSFGWRAVLATLFVAYTFFGIEEIGVEIEDPFGRDDNDLPLERICGTIERDLLSLIDEEGQADAVSSPAIAS